MKLNHPFGAYIASFLPSTPKDRHRRRDNLIAQLDWWLSNTSVPITLFASGWTQSDYALIGLGVDLSKFTVVEQPAQRLILNRIAQLNALYASDHDWGIIMDDDAVLYDGPQHNRGPRLFSLTVTCTTSRLFGRTAGATARPKSSSDWSGSLTRRLGSVGAC